LSVYQVKFLKSARVVHVVSDCRLWNKKSLSVCANMHGVMVLYEKGVLYAVHHEFASHHVPIAGECI